MSFPSFAAKNLVSSLPKSFKETHLEQILSYIVYLTEKSGMLNTCHSVRQVL